MKKTILALLLAFVSLNALADCQSVYIKAALKRQIRNNRMAYGAALVSPLIAPVAVSGGLLLGAIIYDKTLDSALINTFGKVRSALAGDTTITLKKVSRYLKKKDVKVDSDDPNFRSEIAMIIRDLDVSGKACPIEGYDEEFNDKYQIFNFNNFTKLIAEEYLFKTTGISDTELK